MSFLSTKTHGMQAICQFEQNHARVLGHTDKHFAHGFCLLAAQSFAHTPLLLVAIALSLTCIGRNELSACIFLALQDVQPQHTAYDASNRDTKRTLDVLERQELGVNGFKDHPGCYSHSIDTHLSQDRRHCQRMF